MVGGMGSLVVELGARTASLKSDFDRANSMAEKFAADVNVTINKVGSQANFSGVSNQVKGLQADFQRLNNVIAGVFGVGIGLQAVRQAQELADAYQGVTNRVITTASGMAQVVAVQASLFRVAQQTGVELDNTAKT